MCKNSVAIFSCQSLLLCTNNNAELLAVLKILTNGIILSFANKVIYTPCDVILVSTQIMCMVYYIAITCVNGVYA